jgi:hypothetical protein
MLVLVALIVFAAYPAMAATHRSFCGPHLPICTLSMKSNLLCHPAGGRRQYPRTHLLTRSRENRFNGKDKNKNRNCSV